MEGGDSTHRCRKRRGSGVGAGRRGAATSVCGKERRWHGAEQPFGSAYSGPLVPVGITNRD
jgi:hypothetical protein